MAENYYNILGIDKNSSEDEIKKAFRKLALKTHPDKNNGDDIMFKQINEAYEVLSNPSKKQEYDFSLNPNNQVPGNIMFNNFFSSFFQNMNINIRPTINKKNNCIYNLYIPLKDVHKDTVKNIKLHINKKCFNCYINCDICHGKGFTIKIEQTFIFQQQTQIVCENCQGSGLININNFNCSNCQGNGNIKSEEILTVNIPKCCPNGYNILFDNLGEQPQKINEHPGDLIIQINIENDLNFIRKDNDLIYKTQISLSESFIGKDIIIPYFDEDIKINTNIFGIINPNNNYHIKNKGLGGHGDLIINFNIIYPEQKHIDNSNREILANLFKNIDIL
jgi:DnaJ-class molecular chaperone